MADTQWLKKRRQGWYVRVRVPADLQEAVGQSEIVRTLRTTDLKAAQQKRWQALAAIQSELEELRKSRGSLSDESIHVAREVRKGMDLHPEHNADEGFYVYTDEIIDRHKLREADDPKLLGAIRLGHSIVAGATNGLFLADALKLHLDEIRGRVLNQTLNARERRVEAFKDFIGPEVLISDVTRTQAGSYATEMLLPSGRSVKTLRDTVQDIGAFFRWCKGRGYIDSNPFEGISSTIRDTSRGTKEKLAKKRRPFTEGEMVRYLSTLKEKRGWDSPEFAVIAICTYTGMRPEEVCRIETTDVSEEGIFIPEAKTESSVRTVPVHPVLKPLIEHWSAKNPEGYLLGDLKTGGEDGKRWIVIGKNCRYTLRVQAGITDLRVVPYSLRHNFKTALRRLRLPDATIDQIMGHSKGLEAAASYDHGEEIEALKEAVRQVDYGRFVQEIVSGT